MNQIYKSILHEYEKDRSNADNILRMKKFEVYRTIPRIKEIDDELNSTGIFVAKNILNKTLDTKNLVKNLQRKSNALLEEKKYLLTKNGFSGGYFDDIFKCNICKDTGFIDNEKCSCFKQKLINCYYNISNLEGVLEYENFDNFDTRLYSDDIPNGGDASPKEMIEIAYRSALSFVTDFDTSFQNLVLHGETGLGKTFMCNCIAKDLLDKGKTVMYVSAPNLFRLIEKVRFSKEKDETSQEFVNFLFQVDLLIIDDLGTEVPSIVTVSEFINIINSRFLNKKPVVISTNLQVNNLENLYSERVISRLVGNYKWLNFIGDDIRVIKKYSQKITIVK